MSIHTRRTFLGTAVGGLAGLTLWKPFASARTLPDLSGATAWLNTVPLTPSALRGKVVLLDIWTYSCINSLRQLPYLKHWAATYADKGLVVLGVHAPEFAFEREQKNVEMAVRDLRVGYPVAIDSNHAIWRALDNEYWPADYFVDAKGEIRHHHFGEGDYDDAEKRIRALLEENGATGLTRNRDAVVGAGIEAPANFGDVRSPETYVGYQRSSGFKSRERVMRDASTPYTVPPNLSLNEWALGGTWNIGGESAALQSVPGTIAFRFHSRDLHVVLAPRADGAPVRFAVKIDGQLPGDDHGVDAAADGTGVVREPRLYQLIRQRGRIKDRTIEIAFLDPGVRAYAFTFG